MRPSKYQEAEISKAMICGSHSSSLRINRDSHAIHKPAVEKNILSGPKSAPKIQNIFTKRQPVIIYTHTPKVIRTNPQQFMTLVQKLTGMDQSDDEKTIKTDSDPTMNDEGSVTVGKDVKSIYRSSVLTDEKYVDDVKSQDSTSAVSPMFGVANNNNNPYMNMKFPVYDANPSEFLGSSRSNSLYQYPNIGNSILPSFMDYMNGFPEYN